MINIFQPTLGTEELNSIGEVFASNWIGKGKYVAAFEQSFAEHLRTPRERFLSTTCCTEGLFLAPKLFNIGKGDEIIAPAISFVAVGSSVLESGAKLVLCDVDPRSLNVRLEDIEAKVTERTRAVIVTHYGGFPCDMDPILEFCNARNIVVIEDSACSVKAFYKGRACGTLGDMGMWSFDAMKTVCTGDGGMLYVKSPDKMVEATESLYLGLPVRQKSGTDSANTGAGSWWEYEVNRNGRRAIMNNIAGSIGVVQLGKLDHFLQVRKKAYDWYRSELAQVGDLDLPPTPKFDYEPSHYFFWVQSKRRTDLAKYLLENEVYSTFRYWPLHKINGFGLTDTHLPNSDYAAANTLNLPLHQALTDDDLMKITDLIKKFFK